MDDPLDVGAETIANIADEAAGAVDDATDAVQDLVQEKLDHIADLVRLNGEGHTAGLSALSDRIAGIEARFTDAAQSAASDLAEIAEEAVDTAADVPALAADEVEAVIESPKEPPVIKRKGMLGSMRGRKTRR